MVNKVVEIFLNSRVETQWHDSLQWRVN